MSKAKVTPAPWEVYEGYVILNSHGKKRSCMGWVRCKLLHADVGGNYQEILDMETLRVIGFAWLTSSPPIDLHLLPTPTAQEPAGDETRRAVAIEPLLEQVRTACFAVSPDHPEKVAAEIEEAFRLIWAIATNDPFDDAADAVQLWQVWKRVAKALRARLTERE